MIERPPWDAPKDKMVRWMHRKLDDLQQAELDPGRDKNAIRRRGKDHAAWLAAYGPEIEQADYGDIKPLRKRLPHLARFLFLPDKKKKLQKNDPVATAVWAVPRIRIIWQKEYGRKNRTRDQVSAVTIAALWMNVSEDEILKRIKPSGPSGKKKKISRAE
jgi:hypothetical protein